MLEEVYTEGYEWIVDRDSVNNRGHIFSRDDDPNTAWVRWFMLFRPCRDLIQNITNVAELYQFRDHSMALHKLNLRANIINAMEQIPVVRDLRYAPRKFRARASSNQYEFHCMENFAGKAPEV